MEHPSFLDRVRGLARRVLFWLPSSTEGAEQPAEIHHDHALVLSVVAPERVPKIKQLRHIFRYLSLTERRVFLVALMVAIASLGTAFVVFAHGRIVSVPIVGGTLTEGVVGEPKYLDPLDAPLNDVDQDLTHLIYSGLFRFDGTQAVPDLAEQYTWSNDAKTLTVQLRQDARFQDGVPVTSQDVQFTIESAQDPARKSPLAATFQGVSMAIPNAQTIVFSLTQPDAQFMSKLTVGILPAHAWQNIPSSNASLSDLNVKPIGSGPFRVASFTRDGSGQIHSYTLERSNQYYGTKPFLQSVVFEFFSDTQSAEDALKADLIDSVAFLDANDAQQLVASGRDGDLQLDLPQTTAAFFNLKDSTLSSRDVRQALALTVNRNELVTAQKNSAVAISGPYPFAQTTSTQPDIEQARTLLTNAGWVLPSNGSVRIWDPKSAKAHSVNVTQNASSTELALTISYPSDPNLQAIAETLKREWSLLGAKITLEPLVTQDLMHRATRDRNLQVMLFSVLLGPNQDLAPFWWSGQATDRGFNFSNLKDKSVDDALNTVSAATDANSLQQAQQTLSNAILSSVPAVFISRPIQHEIFSKNIHGIPDHTIALTPSERFQTISSWYQKMGWRWK